MERKNNDIAAEPRIKTHMSSIIYVVLHTYSKCQGSILLLILIQEWLSNDMPSKVWHKITYQFSNFNGPISVFWEGISNFIIYFLVNAITNPKTMSRDIYIYIYIYK